MRVLILGATGMLGHKLCQVLGTRFRVTGTVRSSFRNVPLPGPFDRSSIVPGIDVLSKERVESALSEAAPDVVVNAVGIVKALTREKGTARNIAVNSLFPHSLYELCHSRGIHLIHISTDCVFSGRKGDYREEDLSDAEDLYGKTKYLGEVEEDGAVTLRTSFIGRELTTASGLVEWFLSNEGGRINGFTGAIYSGFPSIHLARIIGDLIAERPRLQGIYHVSSEPISKYRLLVMLKEALGLHIEIGMNSDFQCDRSLDSTRFRSETGFTPPSWEQMVAEFVADAVRYPEWRAG